MKMTFTQYLIKVQQALATLKANTKNLPLDEAAEYYIAGDTAEQFAADWFECQSNHTTRTKTRHTTPKPTGRSDALEAAQQSVAQYGKTGTYVRLAAQLKTIDRGTTERKYLTAIYAAVKQVRA